MIMKINLFHVFIFLFMSISTNSNAQSYKKGDVNQDGKVDISDVVAVINIMAHGGGDETFTVNGVSFTMIYVNGGTFMMGATSEQGSDASDSEKPAHSVTLSSFSIGQTEVTQELWEAVMGTNPSCFKGAKLPVEQVRNGLTPDSRLHFLGFRLAL